MSSADEGTTPAHKKRKFQRACDYCRLKKSDGSQLPNNRCSKCTARKTECTYKDALHKGSYPSSYVEHLESRLERMETLLSKLCPEEGVSRELETAQPEKEHLIHTPISERSGLRYNSATPPSTPAMALTPQTPVGSDQVQQSDEEDEVQLEISRQLQTLSITPQPYRYHGRSSALVFLRSAIDLKNQYSEEPQEDQNRSSRHPPVSWSSHSSLFCTHRACVVQWLEHAYERKPPTVTSFPPDDLLESLVSLYFRHMNDTLPLFHEPTFRNGVKNGLHLRHGGFGATVLLVCANASRYTDDRRVLVDGSENWESAGWKWYLAVEDTRKVPLAPAQLYDLQIYVLMATFLQCSTAPQVGWNLVGIGIRVAIDVGVHRRKLYSTTPTIEEELWKRAFWALVMLDWSHCYGLGRPSSIHDEDIDVALPIEVDDEYWMTSGEGHPIKQPEGKPSKISFFVYSIRLCQILAFASRTIYSINKSRSQLEHGDSQWEQRIVAEIDSILNRWMDSLPPHLRWDPDQPDRLFFMQAGILRVHFSQLQIAAHRPFMSVSRRESPLTFPSVIICTNAARSCVQVLETLYKREGSAHYRNMGMLFLAGVVLMMNVWAQRRSGRPFHSGPDITYVRSCMKMLEGMQRECVIRQSQCSLDVN
ncbi:fungal-specific transcription factor domain-containing protein [Fomes fomentarius]|nr:fungal-specific transcription factor domain-containing protein [Fomes fomentarius]